MFYAIMSSGALVLDPMSLRDAVEPLLDFMWHYECVVSPRSIRGCASNVQSATGEESPVSSENKAKGEAISSLCAKFPEHNGFHTSESNEKQGGDAFLINPEDVPAGHDELNSSLASSCDDLTVSARSVRRAPSDGIICIHNGKQVEISSTESSILGADTKWLQRVFDTLDENGDGKISKDELRSSFEKIGIYMSHESILSLLSSVTLQTEGLVDSKEFFLLYQTTCNFIDDLREDSATDNDNDLLEAFNVFDRNRDGFISATELQTVLSSLGFPQAGELATCEEMIRSVDEDGNGQVDFFEFKKMMSLPSAPLAAF